MKPMWRSSKNRNVGSWGWVVKTPWFGSSPSGLRAPAAVVDGDEIAEGKGPAPPLLSVRARRPDRTENGSAWWIGVGRATGRGHGVVRNQERHESESSPAGEVEEAVGKVTGPKGTDGQTCR